MSERGKAAHKCRKVRTNTMEVLLEKHLHQVAADEAITLLDSDANKGLDLFEVQARQQRFGPNAIPVPAVDMGR